MLLTEVIIGVSVPHVWGHEQLYWLFSTCIPDWLLIMFLGAAEEVHNVSFANLRRQGGRWEQLSNMRSPPLLSDLAPASAEWRRSGKNDTFVSPIGGLVTLSLSLFDRTHSKHQCDQLDTWVKAIRCNMGNMYVFYIIDMKQQVMWYKQMAADGRWWQMDLWIGRPECWTLWWSTLHLGRQCVAPVDATPAAQCVNPLLRRVPLKYPS